jgi:hypothetical protein
VFHIAKDYFGDAFIYCDTDEKEFCGCGSVPCVNPDRTFAKNHDFGLRRFSGVRIIPSEHYFIQYRSPVRSIVSNFYLHREGYLQRDSRRGWEKFARKELKFWNRFIDKWVLNFPSSANAPLYCSYESLLADPLARVREFIAFLSDGPVDDETIVRLLKRIPIAARDNLAEFEFFDPTFFRELEDATGERLLRLNLPSFTQAG